jgi:hypothetical protein
MIHPEITEQQVALIREMCDVPGMDVFSQAAPIPSDPLQESIQALQGARDVDHLIELGFVKEITADHQDKLQEMQEKTGRTWRIYQIQPLGRAMFQLRAYSA